MAYLLFIQLRRLESTATISVTNVLNFTASHQGTGHMLYRLSRARNAMFDRIADGNFRSESENTTFFDETEA